MAPRRRRPPELMDDPVTEILLRLPPDDPACLVRASLVCKLWGRLLSDPSFRRRYGEFYGAPPLLGFFHNIFSDINKTDYHFVPTNAGSAIRLSALGCSGRWRALDCRHSRVLLSSGWGHRNGTKKILLVWDPVTGNRRKLGMPNIGRSLHYDAVVLCATAGCNHYICHDDPFLVVLMATFVYSVIDAFMYSSKAGAWSTPVSLHVGRDNFINPKRHDVVVGDGIYFALKRGAKVIKYDMTNPDLSVIDPPDGYLGDSHTTPMVMDLSNTTFNVTKKNSLGLASIWNANLYLWSREVKPEGVAEWEQCKVVELATLIPAYRPHHHIELAGFAEGTGVIFLSRDLRVFMMVDTNSGQVRKVIEGVRYCNALPFISFYIPGSSRLSSPVS